MVLILHIYFNKICVALWCSGQGFACKARWTEFYSRRRWFLLLCAVLFFFLFSFFFNTQSFSLVFLYSYCPPCWSRTFINIYFKLKLGEFYFKSSWSAYWPSLLPEKNISCQDMSLLWNSCIFLLMLVDIRDKQHTVLTPQTVLIYTKNPLAKFKLAICTSS